MVKENALVRIFNAYVYHKPGDQENLYYMEFKKNLFSWYFKEVTLPLFWECSQNIQIYIQLFQIHYYKDKHF